MRFPRPIEITFWEKVNKLDYCWEWKNFITNDGYGLVRFNGKMTGAHRVSYFLTTGKMPDKWVLHKCDNRKCVNPEHLYEGTREDNMNDMKARFRHSNTKKKSCNNGHEYTLDNTRIYQERRYCRACDRLRKEKAVWKA